MKNFKFQIIFLITIFLLVIITGICGDIKNVYNNSVNYNLEYEQATQDQITTFDNKYLAFVESSKITNISKETFIEVTQIIMSSRKDGMNVAWKWVQENQRIPYEEFTVFYKDLIEFTKTRFSENNDLERKKQTIVKEHNKLIKEFPGVFYNYFLNIKPMTYKFGFVSKETKDLFK